MVWRSRLTSCRCVRLHCIDSVLRRLKFPNWLRKSTHFMEPAGSLPSRHWIQSKTVRPILLLSSHLRLGLANAPFFGVSHQNAAFFCYSPLSACVPSISCFFIWDPNEILWGGGAHHEAPHCPSSRDLTLSDPVIFLSTQYTLFSFFRAKVNVYKISQLLALFYVLLKYLLT